MLPLRRGWVSVRRPPAPPIAARWFSSSHIQDRPAQHFRLHQRDAPIDDLRVGDFGLVDKDFPEQSVQTFAELTGDCNPLHLDPEVAAASRFGRPVVHGMLVSALFSNIFGRHFPGAVYVNQELQFRAPVFVGSTVTARCTVLEINAKNNFVTCATECFVKADGDDGGSGALRRAVIRGKATVLLPSLRVAEPPPTPVLVEP